MYGLQISLQLLPVPLQFRVEKTMLIIGAVVAIGLVLWSLSGRLNERFDRTNAEVIQSMLLFVLVGLAALVLLSTWDAIGEALSMGALFESSLQIGIRILFTVVLLIAAYAITRVCKRLLLGGDELRARVISEYHRRIGFYVSQVVIYVVAGGAVLWLWGIELSDLVIGAGVLGIVIALAAREMFGSILAGFMLMLSRPFVVGNWVQIGDHTGIVADITINHVQLRNFDGEYVVIPNETVTNSVVINRSQEEKLRLTVEVGIDYDADPETAEAVALAAMTDLDEIMNHPAPQVLPVQFGDSAVVLELHFWIDRPIPPQKWRAIQAVIHAVKEAFRREGIKMPAPQRELTNRPEAGGFRVVSSEPDDRPSADTHPSASSTEQSE